jgi:arylsulfatase A-like enzyme
MVQDRARPCGNPADKEFVMTARPDILFLVLDTQRVDRLSAYGFPEEISPHLDALAADATRFRHGISTAQWTIPSHTSMFTGVYPAVHRTQKSSSRVPAALPTLAERLQQGGYYTAAFCNNPLVGVVDNGLRRGFYSFLNYSGLLTSRPNQAGARSRLTGRYRQFFKRHLSKWLHRLQDSFARSDALLEFAFTPLMVPLWQTALSFKGNTGKSLNDAARLLVERKRVAQKQPIFAFVNVMGTHMPFHPKREYIERFAPDFLGDKAAQRYLQRFNSDVLGWLTPLGDDMDERRRAIISGMYNAEVATQDEQLGAFFERLRTSGALDRTHVIIVADHGDHLGEKDFVGHSISLYNELTHVPLIIRDPNGDLPRGATVDHPVSTRRLFHTALAAAGLADAGEERYSLAQGADLDRGVVFAEAITDENVLKIIRRQKPQLVAEYRCDQRRRAVWQTPYKLILTGEDYRELFNFVEDARETQNLAAAMPAKVAEMSEFLSDYERQAEAQAVPTGGVAGQSDPQLRQRLRALGYLE